MGTEDHGIHHDHLLRHCGKHPHHNENVEYLVDGEQDACLGQRVSLTFKINFQQFRQPPRHGEEHRRTTEREQVLMFDVHARKVDNENQRPYQDMAMLNKVNMFFKTLICRK